MNYIELFAQLCDSTSEQLLGEFSLSKDLLYDKISPHVRAQLVQQSIACGKEQAEKYGNCESVYSLAKELDITITTPEKFNASGSILFAYFAPPKEIQIMKEPLEKYAGTCNVGTSEGKLPSTRDIQKILIAHELFHCLEDQQADTIFTRTQKINLWHFGPFKNDSTIQTLSEIGAMSFAQHFNHLSYSPFLLDVLLLSGYSEKRSLSLANEILNFVVSK